MADARGQPGIEEQLRKRLGFFDEPRRAEPETSEWEPEALPESDSGEREPDSPPESDDSRAVPRTEFGLPDATERGLDTPGEATADASLRGRLLNGLDQYRWRLGARQTFVLAIVLVVAVLLAGFVFVWQAYGPTPPEPPNITEPAPGPPVGEVPASPTPSPEPEYRIHVLGAVNRPGVVAVPRDARVLDVVVAAGGFTKEANPGELNLAAPVQDGAQVWIGSKKAPGGEVRTGNHLASDGPSEANDGKAAKASGQLDLNRASEAQLQQLPGVGPVTATAIVTWRKQSGPFTSVSQLQEVDGIGPKTLSRLQELVTV